jgi:hypothetical protein
MSNNYILNNDPSPISFEVKVGTTVAVGTVVTRLLPDDSVVDVATSDPAASGNIPNTPLGASSALIDSSLIVTTTLKAGEADDLDQVFQDLAMKVTLHGGADGDQTFKVANADKKKFPADRSIVAVIVVDLQKK